LISHKNIHSDATEVVFWISDGYAQEIVMEILTSTVEAIAPTYIVFANTFFMCYCMVENFEKWK